MSTTESSPIVNPLSSEPEVMQAVVNVETKLNGFDPALGAVKRLVSENYHTVGSDHYADEAALERAIRSARDIRKFELEVINAPSAYSEATRKYILDKSLGAGESPRSTVTIFLGHVPLLYAGFKDERISVWDDHKDKLRPELHFIVGAKEVFAEDEAIAKGVIVGLFGFIESRQVERRYDLTRSEHAHVKSSAERQTRVHADRSYGTVPLSAYTSALDGLMAELAPKEPFTQTKVEEQTNDVTVINVCL